MKDPFDFRRRQENSGAYWLGSWTGLMVLFFVVTVAGPAHAGTCKPVQDGDAWLIVCDDTDRIVTVTDDTPAPVPTQPAQPTHVPTQPAQPTPVPSAPPPHVPTPPANPPHPASAHASQGPT